MPPPERVALAGLGFVLIVVVASAAIRLGADPTSVQVLRAAHRGAATLATLAVIALGWLAWRKRCARAPVAVAAVLVALLAAVGIADGRNPPFGVSMVNIVGGLALAATLAWLAGPRVARGPLLAAFVLVQCVAGAWLTLSWREAPLALLGSHALLGAMLVAAAARLGMRLRSASLRVGLLVIALCVPAAGIAAALLERAPLPATAHATAAVLFVAALTFAQSRSA